MGTTKRYPEEVRERAVRMVAEQQAEHGSQWAAIHSIAGKIGCTAESLRRWVRQAERDHGERAGLSSSERGFACPIQASAGKVRYNADCATLESLEQRA